MGVLPPLALALLVSGEPPFHFLDALVEHGLQIFVQYEALLEVSLRFGLLPLRQPSESPISVGFSEARIKRDGPVKVGSGPSQVAFAIPGDTTITEGFREVRIKLYGPVKVGGSFGQVVFGVPGDPAMAVELSVAGVERNGRGRNRRWLRPSLLWLCGRGRDYHRHRPHQDCSRGL